MVTLARGHRMACAALAIHEKLEGRDHRDTLGSVADLAMLHGAKGDFVGAAALYQRQLENLEKSLGPNIRIPWRFEPNSMRREFEVTRDADFATFCRALTSHPYRT